MKLKLVPTSQFKKDYKLAKKRGYDLSLLEAVLESLQKGEKLEARLRDHALVSCCPALLHCTIASMMHSWDIPLTACSRQLALASLPSR
jgi:mRNA interferase YafQ